MASFTMYHRERFPAVLREESFLRLFLCAEKEDLLGHIGGGRETCCKRIVQWLGTSDVQGNGDIVAEFCLS
jgi:hypothetical protein